MGCFGKAVTVHPHDVPTFEISNTEFPVFLNLKAYETSSPEKSLPKSWKSSSKLSTGIAFISEPVTLESELDVTPED
jgi:hypothetical protein